MKILLVLIVASQLVAQQLIGPGGGGGGFVYNGALSGIPATCSVGQLSFITDATAGQQIYMCSATNSWTQQLNSGSGGASAALDNLAAVNINTGFLFQTGADVGSAAKPPRNLFFWGAGTYSNYLHGTHWHAHGGACLEFSRRYRHGSRQGDD